MIDMSDVTDRTSASLSRIDGLGAGNHSSGRRSHMIPRIGGAILVVTAVAVAVHTVVEPLLFVALGVSLVRGGRDR